MAILRVENKQGGGATPADLDCIGDASLGTAAASRHHEVFVIDELQRVEWEVEPRKNLAARRRHCLKGFRSCGGSW
jgi:hypothetical protein